MYFTPSSKEMKSFHNYLGEEGAYHNAYLDNVDNEILNKLKK
jgi:hypothetical protein